MATKKQTPRKELAKALSEEPLNGRKKQKASEGDAVTISAPSFQVVRIKIKGISPYVQHKFSARKKRIVRDGQEAGSQGKKGKKREPRDFQRDFIEAQHRSEKGWFGIPASGLRAAMVSACRLVGFKMTLSKLGCFVIADGYDADDGTPLVKVTKGEPQYLESTVRNATGVLDLRARPKLDPGWEATVAIQFDRDLMSVQDVTNLLMRVGLQVGIGEGRNDSRKSVGCGWGAFELVQD